MHPYGGSAFQRPSRHAAAVLPFKRPRPDDLDRNAEWDQLIQLVEDAWTWRDPDSLDALAESLRVLRAKVVREWSP